MNPNLRYILAMTDEEEAAFDRMVKRAKLIGVGLPEGFPWDAETRENMKMYIFYGLDYEVPRADAKALRQLADWLEGIEDEND